MKALINKRIIDNNNNDFNNNNPYRNNNNINEDVRAKKKLYKNSIKVRKQIILLIISTKKMRLKINLIIKILFKENDVLNFIKKERQKTPIHSNLKNNFFIDKNDKGNLNKNKKNEQIMNMLNTNKRGTNRILKEGNERYKP